MRIGVLVVAAALAAVGASGAWGAAGTTVSVQLKEFKVIPKPASAKPGTVTFSVKNVGKVDHELVVVMTSAAPGKLPVKGSKASEKGKVGRVAALKPGKSGKVTLNVKAGKYVLLCNVPGHYQAGQYVGFTVK